jgi:hypothetical protein
MRVRIYASRAEFGDTLGSMREWLDRNQCPVARFETAAEGDLIQVSIEFASEISANAFQQEFEHLRATA